VVRQGADVGVLTSGCSPRAFARAVTADASGGDI
jgi:hypothetical protein